MWNRKRKPILVFISMIALAMSVFMGCSLPNTPDIAGETFFDKSANKLGFYPIRRYVTVGDTIPLLVGGLHKGYDCGKITDVTFFKLQDTLFFKWSLEWPKNSHNCRLIPVVDSLGDSVLQYSFLPIRFEEGMLYLKGSTIADSAFLTQNKHHIGLSSHALDSSWIKSVGGISWTNDKPVFKSTSLKESVVNVLRLSHTSLKSQCGDSLSYGYYCINKSQDSLFLRLASISSTECLVQDSLGGWPYQHRYFHTLPSALRDTSKTCLQNFQSL